MIRCEPSARHAASTSSGRTIMTTCFLNAAFSAALVCLSLSAGAAQAQTNTDAMKKPEAMKTDGMSKDSMKTHSTTMVGSKADCVHTAGMEKDSMKKSDMMKSCDAMK
jgi:pentapeptide MXKDX repeat protein